MDNESRGTRVYYIVQEKRSRWYGHAMRCNEKKDRGHRNESTDKMVGQSEG